MSRVLDPSTGAGALTLGKDQRTAVRFRVRPEGCWNINVAIGDCLHYATVHNLSLRGIGLLLDEEVWPGMTAQAELTGLSGLHSCARGMQIVHVTSLSSGKHLVGCRFTLPLTGEVLESLLRDE